MRVLALGFLPLPMQCGLRQYAANLRTWHLVQPLLEDGHDVTLFGCKVPEAYADKDPTSEQESIRDGLTVLPTDGPLFHDRERLEDLIRETRPDAIVGINTYPASRAVQARTDLPIWCDLNGWVMAEAQAKAFVYDDDRYLSHFWNMERSVLDRADVISTVSQAQAGATYGELAARGRLGKRTFGYSWVHTIPNAVSDVTYRHDHAVIRNGVVPEDAFVVLWVGGYNTWTDTDLLSSALDAAMEEIDSLHFVSTGGAIPGHDELTFERFLHHARTSRFKDRYHFVGWVPTEHVPSYYFESDLGINVDSDNCETTFGARNRLNDMMKAGLPVLTTLGTEISWEIHQAGAGLTAPLGDVSEFTRQIVWAARNRDELRQRGEKAREWATRKYSYSATTGPLRQWIRNPRRAPDMGQRVAFLDIDFFRDPLTPTPESEQRERVLYGELDGPTLSWTLRRPL